MAREAEEAKKTWRDEYHGEDAFYMAEHFVKKKLKSPSTAKFPGIYQVAREKDGQHIIKVTDQTYRIRSYVDSQNAFGATVRLDYDVLLIEVEEGRWKVAGMDMKQR